MLQRPTLAEIETAVLEVDGIKARHDGIHIMHGAANLMHIYRRWMANGEWPDFGTADFHRTLKLARYINRTGTIPRYVNGVPQL